MSLQNTVEKPKKDKPQVRSRIAEQWRARRENSAVLLLDILHMLLAVLFARCHVLFGAYPLGIALVAALPARVPLTTLGAVLGALSMGRAGLVYAPAAVITMLLRMAVSGTAREGGGLFREKRSLRACAATIGAFVCGVYEVLLGGLVLTTVLYAAAMTASAGVLAYLFSGMELVPTTVREYVLGEAPLYAGRPNRTGRLRVECELAQASFLFFVPFSLQAVELFGISAAYVTAAFATLWVAKRFGTLRGMAAGFIAMLGLSTTHAVAYALGGLAAGLLFPFGVGYALVGAAAAVGGWSALSSGLVGFVSAFPEFAIAAALAAPLCRRVRVEPTEQVCSVSEQRASDMVGTMALAHRATASAGVRRLEEAFAALPPVLKDYMPTDTLRECDVRRLLRQTLEASACCAPGGSFEAHSVAADRLVDKVLSRQALCEEDFLPYSEQREDRARLLDALTRRLAAEEAERYHEDGCRLSALFCEVTAKLLNERRADDEREATPDTELSRKLTQIMLAHGFPDGVVRAYGDRRLYILAAAEDEQGERITDPSLLDAFAEACGTALTTPTFFRKDRMVLLECRSAPRYRVDVATAAAARGGASISGDSVTAFCDADDCQYLVLSDGMGTGEDARRASALCSAYLRCMMGAGCNEGTALYLLNRMLRCGAQECSCTVDLFSFDLVRGEGEFYKSGAAPSYLKRASSLFRIRSQTTPVGLLRTLDAERIKVDVRVGDIIVLLSDGVSASPEEDPWLVELLSRPHDGDLHRLAESILQASRQRRQGEEDDRTVLVARITSAEELGA